MALQDLTPQLRTRLNRMERAVGWFVFLATALLVFGFGYYVYKTAKRKGWFIPRAPYYTFTERATGLKVGDPVVLMGFEVGQITLIDTMPPSSYYDVYVEFEIKEPYNGYLWTGKRGSRAKVAAADLLGKRVLEVTKGYEGYPAYSFHPLERVPLGGRASDPRLETRLFAAEYFDSTGTNLVVKAWAPVTPQALAQLEGLGRKEISVLNTNETRKRPVAVWDDRQGGYTDFIPKSIPEKKIEANLYWFVPDETPAITERLEALVDQVQKALPGVLQLTNKIAELLANGNMFASNLNFTVLQAQPAISNLTQITTRLQEPGSLGDWALGTAGRQNAETVLGNANYAVSNANLAIAHADSNLVMVMEKLALSLNEVAGITSNLHAQVEANTNILGSMSKMIVDADDMIQGLKRHWLLRSAFKSKHESTDSTEAKEKDRSPQRIRSPRDSGNP